MEVWKAWCRLRDQDWRARRDFCRQHFLSLSALEALESVRRQIRGDLVACGFAAPEAKGKAAGGEAKKKVQEDYSANEHDVNLLKVRGR